uniref:Rhodanese domain-containing protein n=1 Tax=Aureoumbra lagunensis TaxID=44058 RepID=A0A6S8CEP7_9STRA|mmetsp:Transcript_11012/g.15194  ORF Transcript_11012/g.15194 Transcript_11012/m.15194 type:complete len:492 (+) Transcript_11012:66-1541(+)
MLVLFLVSFSIIFIVNGLIFSPQNCVRQNRLQKASYIFEELEVVEARCIESELSLSNPVVGPYTDGRHVIISEIEVDTASLVEKKEESCHQQKCVAYPRAGPWEKISLDPTECTAAIVTCGGLCPGLNTVVQELYRTLYEQYGVKRVYGIKGGYGGLADEDFEPMEKILNPSLYRQGGTILGTSRGQCSAEEMVKSLTNKKINALFVVGGDGTLRGAKTICTAAPELRLIAVPKTIDNDIPIIDKSFGFDTAVEAARNAIHTASVEAQAFPRGLGLVRLMGRDAGFLAVHATLACPGDVDACLIKESGFDLDQLIHYLEHKLNTKGSAVLVVAEGIGNKLQPNVDIGPWLADTLKKRFALENGGFTLKYVDPGYAVRAIGPNAADTILCSRLAANAVHAAMAGYTDCAIATLNAQYAIIPLDHLVSRASILAVNGHLWAELIRSTGQPDFHLNHNTPQDELAIDLMCDDQDNGPFRESPSGGCVVTYHDEA